MKRLFVDYMKENIKSEYRDESPNEEYVFKEEYQAYNLFSRNLYQYIETSIQ